MSPVDGGSDHPPLPALPESVDVLFPRAPAELSLEASWQALSDSIVFGLLPERDREEQGV